MLFNRFLQVDIDPETLAVDAGFELSQPGDAAFARTWIALLRDRCAPGLAAHHRRARPRPTSPPICWPEPTW